MQCCWCEKEGLDGSTPTCPYCQRVVANLLAPGSLLRDGRYRIEKALGQGGFGITYRAFDTRFQRRVAIKEFFPKGHAHRDTTTGNIHFESISVAPSVKIGLDGFRAEGQKLAQVEHSNIPSVYEDFDASHTAYLVMAFIEGKSLRDLMPVVEELPDGKEKRRPLPPDQVRRIMAGLVSALAAVHAQGIYHLDIKPDNILITEQGKAVLVDFGAARQGTTFNTSSLVALTPQYAPPELLVYQPYGSYTDIYEMGVILYEMLSGELPPTAQMRMHSSKALTWHPATQGEPWYSLLTDALQMDPKRRPQDIRLWWGQAKSGDERSGPVLIPQPKAKKTIPILPIGIAVAVAWLGIVAGFVLMRPKTSPTPPVTNGVSSGNASSPATPVMQTKINAKDDAAMVLIPEGAFIMGSQETDEETFSDEQPQRSVTLSGFWMYQYPVTVKQYKKFATDTKREMPEAPSYDPQWFQEELPMVNVTWEDANAYSEWVGGKLPTEAQWERAARGTEGQKYPWGNTFDDNKLWCSVVTKRDKPAPVNRKTNVCVSPSGCVDMAGNIQQWCNDWYQADYQKSAPAKDPTGPDTGDEHLLRGGSWSKSNQRDFRTARRDRDAPTSKAIDWGFRVVVHTK